VLADAAHDAHASNTGRRYAGCGERQTFKNIFMHIEKSDINLFKRVAVKIPELGRWDDLLVADTDDGFKFISE